MASDSGKALRNKKIRGLKENMEWPPMDLSRYKMEEHSAWYSGEAEILANFYFRSDFQSYIQLDYGVRNSGKFWARQIKNKTRFFVHVPIANDIAETSSAFLFGESPIIRFPSDSGDMKAQQKALDDMLVKSGFYMRLIEGAEVASAIGGVYFKIAWDSDLSEEPIPVIVQCEQAFPVFKHGQLQEVTFVYEVDNDGSTVYRLAERVTKGAMHYALFKGSASNLGTRVDFNECKDTEGMQETTITPDILCAVYVPNLLPNKLDRTSNMGRSDYQGIETLMDSLDEVFTDWMIDIQYAKGKIHLPQGYLKGKESGDDGVFDIDQTIYVEMDVDPTSMSKELTPTQFAIRSEEFEKTCLNLLDRIITSAGYSPQSFGLNIAGRAESGTALNLRERKSFSTTSKKQAYWEAAIKHFVKAMLLVKTQFLGGSFTNNLDVNVSFVDGVSNNLSEISASVKTLSDAKAISTKTKIQMVHPEWTDKQVEEEIERINNDGGSMIEDPDASYGLGFGATGNNPKGEDANVTDGMTE